MNDSDCTEPMSRKTKIDAQKTRTALLDAAEHVFLARGVSCSSLEQVAKTAGVTRGAVYWHFRNKYDLLEALLDRIRAPMTELISNSAQDDIAQLEQVCRLALCKLEQDEQYRRVFMIIYHRSESDHALQKLADNSRRSYNQLYQIFSKPENKARLLPGLDPASAALHLHSHMEGIIFGSLLDPSRWQLSQQADTIVAVIFRGLFQDTL